MPTTYAHWRFGAKCIEKMPKNLQTIIHENRDIYNLGVHGPDILFYDLFNSKVTKYGDQMHNIPAGEFFAKCKKVFNTHEEKAQMLAYIMGFLTHFTLDSTCHGYVDRKKEVAGISHNLIEAQWDRHVMELDNRIPYLVDRAESLRPNKKNTQVISYFYPYDKKTILKTCKAQHTVIHALNCISIKKENFLKKVLNSIKKYDYVDLFIGFEEKEECRDSNLRLDKLCNKALKQYPKLMKNLLNYLNDKEELIDYFDHDFAPWPDYKKIEVLSYKQELKYKV